MMSFKIPCGGFKLDEQSFSLDVNGVLSVSGGGGGVQPDWNQNDSTAANYVKNRPFYTGDPVETVLVEESTVSFAAEDGVYMGVLKSTFVPTVGETYKVSWDGTTYESTCVNFNSLQVIGNLSIMGIGSDTGEPFLVIVPNSGRIQIATSDTSTSHTFSISGFVREVVKIDEKYLPENIATKSDVEAAQTTAENAQSSADNAQATVNNAQNMSNSNKEVLYSAFGSAVTFTFDKQTSGRDKFVFNTFNYYKISDFNAAPEEVISFRGTSEKGIDRSTVNTGNNCMQYGFFIVVAAAGHCSITFNSVEGPVTMDFTAPSAGLYAQYVASNSGQTAGTGEFTLRVSTGSLSITGLLLKSSTDGSDKQFKITVDDSGAITATQV